MDTLIRERLAQYLNSRISLREFQAWFVPATWELEETHNRMAYDLASEIELKLAEYTNGHLSESQLREELRRILENETIEITIGIKMPKQRTQTDAPRIKREAWGE